MNTDPLNLINKEIENLINDKTKYSFEQLKQKVEEILKDVDLFMIDGNINSKAVDLYLKNVITKRNNIQKEQEKVKIDNSKETRYTLIEEICKKHDFTSQEELIEKIDELKKKTNFELNEINNSF